MLPTMRPLNCPRYLNNCFKKAPPKVLSINSLDYVLYGSQTELLVLSTVYQKVQYLQIISANAFLQVTPAMVEALLEECRTRSLSRQGQSGTVVAQPSSSATTAELQPATGDAGEKNGQGPMLEKKERNRGKGKRPQEKELKEREARRERDRDRERRDRRAWERVRERELDRDERRWREREERRERDRSDRCRAQREGSSDSKSSEVSEGSRQSSRRDAPESTTANKVWKICSEMKINDAERNVQKNNTNNTNWREQDNYSIYNKKRSRNLDICLSVTTAPPRPKMLLF